MSLAKDTVISRFLPKNVLGKKLPNTFAEPAASYVAPRPLVDQIRSGLPFSEFSGLRDLLELPEEDLGRMLGMSNATLHRRKKAHQLNSAESERLIRFARLFGLATDTFDTCEAARSWLKTPNPGMTGETPLAYADTEFGAREVENLLGRVMHGVF